MKTPRILGYSCLLLSALSVAFPPGVHALQTPSSASSLRTIEVPEFIDVAHRGASGYLPEHSLASTVMAHALGADYIEQDIQLSRDGIPIVLHDLHLENISNVAEVFPGRHRPDGHYYAVDFSVNHLQRLTLIPRQDDTGKLQYPERFSIHDIPFKIQTLAENLALIKELNRVRGTNVGVFIEIKAPRWYHRQDYDITAATMRVLEQAGYKDGALPTPIYLQSFSPETLRRLKREFHVSYPLVQLIADNSWNESNVDYDALRSYAGMESVSSYAEAVGLWLGHVLVGVENGEPQWQKVLDNARHASLPVFVYTLRADDLPKGVSSHKQLREWLKQAGVEGAFSDFPDQK